MNYTVLDTIARQYDTPFYLMDEDVYLKNITAFQEAFKNNELKTGICYWKTTVN